MRSSRTLISPYACGAVDRDAWRDSLPIPITTAALWNKYVPRGKGWFARLVGKALESRLRGYSMATQHGARLAIEPRCLDVYVHLINHGLVWNEHVLSACLSGLEAGGAFFDVGANVGIMTLEVAMIYGDTVQVVAFEPQLALAHAIAVSAELNGFRNVSVFDVMLGDESGRRELYVGSHSIHASMIPRELGSKRIECGIHTIDELVESGSAPAPTVIKMDIEGAELAALRGATAVISRYQPHIVFEADMNMQRYGHTVDDMLELISSLAPYDFFLLGKEPPTRQPIQAGSGRTRHGDVLAVPRF